MSEVTRPSQPAPLGDYAPLAEETIARPSLRATGFVTLADLRRMAAEAEAAANSAPQADEPAQGC